MHRYLEAADRARGRHADDCLGTAAALPAATGSVDHVVSTLVRCSAPDPVVAIEEIRRVLRPGGSFVFVEHVAAPAGSSLRAWQERLLRQADQSKTRHHDHAP